MSRLLNISDDVGFACCLTGVLKIFRQSEKCEFQDGSRGRFSAGRLPVTSLVSGSHVNTFDKWPTRPKRLIRFEYIKEDKDESPLALLRSAHYEPAGPRSGWDLLLASVALPRHRLEAAAPYIKYRTRYGC